MTLKVGLKGSGLLFGEFNSPERLRVCKTRDSRVSGAGFSRQGMEAEPRHKSGHGLWDLLALLP